MGYLMGNGNQKSMQKSIYNKMFGNKLASTEKAKEEKLSSQFRFKLSSQTKAKLELLSKASGKSQGAIVREGIEAFSKVQNGKSEIVLGGKIFTKASKLRAKRIK